MRIISLITLLLTLITSSALALEGTFLDKAEVSKRHISLGDIVFFSEDNQITRALASQRVATAPGPNKSITLDSYTILRQLASQHLLPPEIRWKGASKISVVSKGITINPEKINQIIDQFLQSELDKYPDAEFQFTPESLPMPFTLPAGEVAWKVVPSKPGVIGSSRFSVVFRVDGKVRKNISVRGDLKALMPVAVATQTLKANEPLSSSNVTMEVRDIADIRGAVFDKNQLSGKQATRTIKAGKVIQTSYLKSIPLVHRGEMVKVVLRSGGLQLTTKGIARSDGGLNDVIRVQNTNSNKFFYCQVTAPGLVEVKL